jgi:hypothetical protein
MIAVVLVLVLAMSAVIAVMVLVLRDGEPKWTLAGRARSVEKYRARLLRDRDKAIELDQELRARAAKRAER